MQRDDASPETLPVTSTGCIPEIAQRVVRFYQVRQRSADDAA
jgi:hypothetical protein